MGAPALCNGRLPMGRWTCTLPEAEAAYVPIDSGDRRREIWAQWYGLTQALRTVVGEVAACWLSGSFFTDKPVPGDIDCLYVVDTDRIEAVRASDRIDHIWFLYQVTTSMVKAAYRIPVDSFVLEWTPTPGPTRPVHARSYFEDRGYWDDLWARVKDQDTRLDSVPRRGYLEVIVDGYR